MGTVTFFGVLIGSMGIIAQRQKPWEARRLEYNPPEDPMSLITGTGLARSYGAQDVFSQISLAIPHQARIALVGPNGIGKTTLLRLVAGLDRPDAGRVQRARGLKIGYLPQEVSFSRSQRQWLEQCVWDLCLQGFSHLRSQEAELAELEAAMADVRRAEEAIDRYGALQESFERAGGYTYPIQIRRVLNGLGFRPQDDQRLVRHLSGGERTRLLLARLLLDDPGLLILDEPTNHLDLAAIEWLEAWLREWPGAAVLVSHDRFFLDHTVDRVWELTPTDLEVFSGNYTAYQAQRAERLGRAIETYQQEQALIGRETEFIRRNIAGQNSRQARGRRKRLERMLRQAPAPRLADSRAVRIGFGPALRSGDRVLETHDLRVGHADASEALFSVPDLLLQRGECAALIGPNGAGKTTFLRTILGELAPLEGKVKLGAGVQIGYFAQAHQDLDPELTVIEAIQQLPSGMGMRDTRDFLAGFLFTGDDGQKRIADLSGGERGRLALARLVLQGANVLFLDEPTNHLDLPSQEVLQTALERFGGTILLVSHDRYLIDALATQIWRVAPEDGRLEVFAGRYEEYQAWQRARQPSASPKAARPPQSRPPRAASSAPDRHLAHLEAEIQTLEEQLQSLSEQLTAAGSDIEQITHLGEQYAQVERALEIVLADWESLARSADRA
jgi:ATP-binding cassette, subfamily F, member 3